MRRNMFAFALFVFAASSVAGYLSVYGEGIVAGTGTIKFIDLEGGFYAIVSDDGEKYDPLDLASEFHVNGLRVYFKVKILRGIGTFHMWGKPVSVLNIQKI